MLVVFTASLLFLLWNHFAISVHAPQTIAILAWIAISETWTTYLLTRSRLNRRSVYPCVSTRTMCFTGSLLCKPAYTFTSTRIVATLPRSFPPAFSTVINARTLVDLPVAAASFTP